MYLNHGITRDIEMMFLKDYISGVTNGEFEEYPYEDYLKEFGYNGELYVCYEEFLDNEFLNFEYMEGLLSMEDKILSEELMEMYNEHFKTNVAK